MPGDRVGALRREDGFTILELTVALVLAVIMMIGVAVTLRGALATSRANRFRQDATSIAMEAFEFSRGLDWDELAMTGIDPQAPLIDPDSGMLLSSETGLPGNEPLLVCAGGRLPPQANFTIEDVDYTAWVYVTQVNGSLRRVFVEVEWLIEGTTSSYQSESVISIVSAGGITAVDQPLFPEAAIVATGNVQLLPGETRSLPASAHTASIWLNQSFSNLDALVDGDIVAGGVVNATPANVYGRIEQNAGTPVNVPTPAELEGWRSGMRATAAAGGTSYGNTVVAGGTITAPLYIDGTLELQGNVHVLGTGPVFATGMIRLQAGSLITADGAYLVSEDTVRFENGAEYRVSEITAGGVVAFADAEHALYLQGGDTGTIQGLAYAPYGGITLTGTESWHGSLVAHGLGGLGDIDMAGGVAVEYPANLLPTSAIVNPLRPPPVASACGG